MKNITGKRFGMLTVIERAGKAGSVQLIRCKCDCGNEVVVRYPNLTSGTTSSCGCLKRKRTSEKKIKDLVGQTFGHLTVVERFSPIGGKKVFWKCVCSCGHTCVVSGSNLKTGNTTSCGCMNASFNEMLIDKILSNSGVRYEREAKFADLLAPSGNPLRFDFKVCTTDGFFLIEYQGSQHYFEQAGIGKFERDYSDNAKRKYCAENNIELVEITYQNDTEQVMYNILERHSLLHDNTVPSSDKEKV